MFSTQMIPGMHFFPEGFRATIYIHTRQKLYDMAASKCCFAETAGRLAGRK
jgi:hypothetical protein